MASVRSIRWGVRRSRWAVGLALALLAGLPLASGVARASESCNGTTLITDASNTSTSPSTVTTPVVCLGDLGGADSADWFGVNISPQLAGQTLVIAMRQTFSTASQPPIFNLQILDPSNTPQQAPDGNILGIPVPTDLQGCLGSGTFETLPNACVFSSVVSGLWKIGVVPAPNSSSATGSYLISIATTISIPNVLGSCEPTGDAGNSQATARTLNPAPKAMACSGTLTPATDGEDWFAFSLNSPFNEIQVGVIGTNGPDVDVTIVGPSGTTCTNTNGGSTCTGSEVGGDTVIGRGPGCAGVPNCWAIRVFLHPGSAGGSYSMDIQEVNP